MFAKKQKINKISSRKCLKNLEINGKSKNYLKNLGNDGKIYDIMEKSRKLWEKCRD